MTVLVPVFVIHLEDMYFEYDNQPRDSCNGFSTVCIPSVLALSILVPPRLGNIQQD